MESFQQLMPSLVNRELDSLDTKSLANAASGLAS